MAKKAKRSTYEIVREDERPELYDLMNDLVADHHDELRDARIAIAWRHGWKPDADGRTTLGQLKKASDLDRQLHSFDLIVLLNFEVWTSVSFTEAQQRALFDHYLERGALQVDAETGEPKYTPDGKLQYRLRKPDIEEFGAIVRRHGMWTGGIAAFVEAAMASKAPAQMTLESGEVPPAAHIIAAMIDSNDSNIRDMRERLRPAKGSGIDSVTISTEGHSVTLEAR